MFVKTALFAAAKTDTCDKVRSDGHAKTDSGANVQVFTPLDSARRPGSATPEAVDASRR
jgi:hypothetical protein